MNILKKKGGLVAAIKGRTEKREHCAERAKSGGVYLTIIRNWKRGSLETGKRRSLPAFLAQQSFLIFGSITKKKANSHNILKIL